MNRGFMGVGIFELVFILFVLGVMFFLFIFAVNLLRNSGRSSSFNHEENSFGIMRTFFQRAGTIFFLFIAFFLLSIVGYNMHYSETQRATPVPVAYDSTDFNEGTSDLRSNSPEKLNEAYVNSIKEIKQKMEANQQAQQKLKQEQQTIETDLKNLLEISQEDHPDVQTKKTLIESVKNIIAQTEMDYKKLVKQLNDTNDLINNLKNKKQTTGISHRENVNGKDLPAYSVTTGSSEVESQKKSGKSPIANNMVNAPAEISAVPTWMMNEVKYPEVVLHSEFCYSTVEAEKNALEELKKHITKIYYEKYPNMKSTTRPETEVPELLKPQELETKFVLQKYSERKMIDLGIGSQTPMYKLSILAIVNENKIVEIHNQFVGNKNRETGIYILCGLGMITMIFGLTSRFSRKQSA